MKCLALIAALSAFALPAVAQSWTTQQFGGQTRHTGTDQNGDIWTGNTQQLGNQTRSTFYGPSGQTTVCTSNHSGSQTRTDCY